jgi:hypothetical protein
MLGKARLRRVTNVHIMYVFLHIHQKHRLVELFGNKLIALFHQVEWLPYLTTCDFFIYGICGKTRHWF